jgi:hypothetical protein
LEPILVEPKVLGTAAFLLGLRSMSARIIYIEKDRGRTAAAEKMHDSGAAAVAQSYAKLVYCIAAWTGVSANTKYSGATELHRDAF